MSIANMTVRIESKIAYSDGSKDSLAMVFEDGQVKNEDQYGDAQAAFDQLYRSNPRTTIQSILSALGGTHTFTQAAPAQPKTVSEFTFIYSGVVARSNQSKDTWQVTFDQKGGIVVTNASVYAEIRADATGLANLKALWQGLVGVGTVVIH